MYKECYDLLMANDNPPTLLNGILTLKGWLKKANRRVRQFKAGKLSW